MRLKTIENILGPICVIFLLICVFGSLPLAMYIYRNWQTNSCNNECFPYKSYIEDYDLVCRCAGPDLKVLSNDERCRNVCHPYIYKIEDSCKCFNPITKMYNETN
jgi:hypothetical protein